METEHLAQLREQIARAEQETRAALHIWKRVQQTGQDSTLAHDALLIHIQTVQLLYLLHDQLVDTLTQHPILTI